MFLPFYEWCNNLAMSQAFRESNYYFAITQSLHLVAITVFIGALLIGDLRMLGWVSIGQSRTGMARSAQQIVVWAGLAVLATGIPQFTTNALTYEKSWLFGFKMCVLAVALIFTATLRRQVTVADEGRLPSWVPKIVGAVSIALWMGVTVSGRLITYYG